VTLANAWLESGEATEAITRLESERTPVRADVELVLARAWLATGNTERAVDALYRIFYTMPTSEQAAAADAELQQLALKGPITPPTVALRRTRADLLLKNRQSSDAVPEYQALLQQASEAEVRPLQMELAVALYRSGNHREAGEILQQMGDQADEFRARRMFYQLEIARPDQEKVSEIIGRIRDLDPSSPWFQEGLLSAGNTYLLKNDFKTAAGFYAELATLFPEGKYGPYAAWKSAWLELRLGRQAEAKSAVERYIDRYPQGPELSAALYWRGRIAEDEKDLPIARAYYSKNSERFFNSYYAALSRERLAEIDPTGEKADDPLLLKIVAPQPPANVPLAAPADDLRVQKSKLLENAGLVDFAARELQAAGASSEWLAGEMARLYRDSGIHYRALQTVKRAVPGYYSFQLTDLPRPVWEYLFPRAYWEDLSHYASANGLDPYLVASLIRQESEFNAAALSRANAMGLMQILPGTGKRVAKQLRIRGFDSSLLLDPTYNLQLGTRYFRDLLKRYDGRIEYALAAYNAGPERVDEWKKGTYRDMPEFVESIPFTETREYVQAIVRNVSLYQRLYQNP
jgi:soluble lytic murein transglycosylase